jgi:hypothetical protein
LDCLSDFFCAFKGGFKHVFLNFVESFSDGEDFIELNFGDFFFFDDELLVFRSVDITAKVKFGFGAGKLENNGDGVVGEGGEGLGVLGELGVVF